MNELTGLTKDEATELIMSKDTWTNKEVRHMIHTLKTAKSKKWAPTKIKVGDIFYHVPLVHPAIVVNISETVATCVLLSSSAESTHLVLCATESRFIPGTVFTTCVCKVDVQYVQDQYLTTYDNKTHLKQVYKLLKYFLTKTL
jgi:hypothetical protein